MLPRAPTLTPSASTAPTRLAGILDDAEAVAAGERLERRHVRRVAEHVNRQQSDSALTAGGRGRLGIDVEGDGVDVAEDRLGALVEEAVGGGDEAERARDDLVPPSPPHRAHAEVKRGRAARHGDRIARRRARRRNRCSKRSSIGPSDSRPERSTSSTSSSSRWPMSGCASGICLQRPRCPGAAASGRLDRRERRPCAAAGRAPRLHRVLERVDERLPARLDDVLRDADRAPGVAGRRTHRSAPA